MSLLRTVIGREIIFILSRGVPPDCILGFRGAGGGVVTDFIDPPHMLRRLKMSSILGRGLACDLEDSSFFGCSLSEELALGFSFGGGELSFSLGFPFF